MAISSEQIVYTYKIAKKAYEKEISKDEAIQELVTKAKMNEGSVKIILVQIFPKLMNGEKFTRTLSVAFFEYFLVNILKDYGHEKLSLALNGLKKHIDYIANRGDSKIKLRIIYKKYLEKLTKPTSSMKQDENEQDEIVLFYKKNKTKQEVIENLLNAKEKEPEIIIINSKSYKRDNKTIAQIKYIRGFKCQICNTSIIKKDGSRYVEAAHITPKYKTGQETPDNIILLCPNHHKEFDLGNRQDINRTKEYVEFVLNGKKYKISLLTK